MKTAEHAPSYRADIDGLRALAILVVLLFHAHVPGLKGGFIGVDVFFVISGFLITQILRKEMAETGTIGFKNFYAKRVRRLFPAMGVTVLGTILLWAIFLAGVPEDTHKFVKSVRYAVFGFANIFFQRSTGGYFDGASDEMPLLHFWSLAVEEQFYFVWPLLIWAMGKERRIFVALLGLTATSLVFSQYLLLKGLNSAAFYWMPSRAWEMGLGALVTFVVAPFGRFFRRSWHLQSIAGLGALMIATAVGIYGPDASFPGTAALLPTVGTLLVILAGTTPTTTWVGRGLSASPIIYLGKISYGLYLWHWPLLAMLKLWHMGETPPAPQRLAAIALSFALAHLTLKFIENPIRFGPSFKRIGSGKTILLGIAWGGAITGAAYALRAYEAHTLSDEWKRFSTHVQGPQADPPATCPPGASPSTMVLWGDSHAQANYSILSAYLPGKDVCGLLYWGSGMPGLVTPPEFSLLTPKITAQALAQNKAVVAAIEGMVKKGRKVSVMLADRWTAYTGVPPISVADGPQYMDKAKTREGSLKVLEASLQLTLKELRRVGVERVLIVLPYPEFKFQSSRCFKVRKPELCQVDRARMEMHAKAVVEVIARARSSHPGVRTVDPMAFFCDGNTCPQIMLVQGESVPVSYDDDHLSHAAAKPFAAAIKGDLDWLSGAPGP